MATRELANLPITLVGASLLAMAVCQLTMFLLVYISVSAVTAACGFALTATHFFSNAKKSKQKTLAPSVRPLAWARRSFAAASLRGHRLRFAALHLLSMCAASPHGAARPLPG